MEVATQLYYQLFVQINGQESFNKASSDGQLQTACSENRLFNVNDASMAKYWYRPGIGQFQNNVFRIGQ